MSNSEQPTQANEPEVQSKPYVDPALALEADVEKLTAENADLKDRLLRTMAELENLRRRTEKEIKDTSTYAITKFARDVLGVADNLRRAIETAPAEAKLEGSPALTILEGVELTERTLLQTLERYGVKTIDALGTKFDPNLHQAMFEVESAEHPAGTVTQVVQSGFVLGERTLRPALVGVAKAVKTANA